MNLFTIKHNFWHIDCAHVKLSLILSKVLPLSTQSDVLGRKSSPSSLSRQVLICGDISVWFAFGWWALMCLSPSVVWLMSERAFVLAAAEADSKFVLTNTGSVKKMLLSKRMKRLPGREKVTRAQRPCWPCSWAERNVIFWMNYFLTSGIVAIRSVFVIPQNPTTSYNLSPSVDNDQKGNLTRHQASDVTTETVTYHSRNSEWIRRFLWQNRAYLSTWTQLCVELLWQHSSMTSQIRKCDLCLLAAGCRRRPRCCVHWHKPKLSQSTGEVKRNSFFSPRSSDSAGNAAGSCGRWLGLTCETWT